MKRAMIKKISFGKVDGYHIGRKTTEVVIEVGYRQFKGREPYFTVCGNLWNNLHTDIIRGGQCIDSLAEEFPQLRNNPQYMKIVDLWKRNHLKKVTTLSLADINAINNILW